MYRIKTFLYVDNEGKNLTIQHFSISVGSKLYLS